MANLKDIRDRIKSVRSIQKVTKAMKMVAAAKMRKAQERMEQARPYSNSLSEVIEHLLPDIDRERLPLLNLREIKRKAYVVVCADRGLAGAFNTNLLKIAQKEIDEFGKDGTSALGDYEGRDIATTMRLHFNRKNTKKSPNIQIFMLNIKNR